MKKFLLLITAALLVANFSFGQDIFFSEYVEGSSNNKALEIYNPTDADIDLTTYMIKGTANDASEWEYDYEFPEGATIPAMGTYIIVHESASEELKAFADWVPEGYYLMGFNGDDARALAKKTDTDPIIIDAIGDINDPSIKWSVAGTANATAEHTLQRKTSVTGGNTDWASSAGTTVEDSEWIVLDQDVFSGLGVFGGTSAIKNIDNTITKIYSFDKVVTINTSKVNSTVRIFDLTGKEVVKQTIEKGISKINVNAASGVYFVKVSNGTDNEIQKVFIK